MDLLIFNFHDYIEEIKRSRKQQSFLMLLQVLVFKSHIIEPCQREHSILVDVLCLCLILNTLRKTQYSR